MKTAEELIEELKKYPPKTPVMCMNPEDSTEYFRINVVALIPTNKLDPNFLYWAELGGVSEIIGLRPYE